jgi:hypothetical protein
MMRHDKIIRVVLWEMVSGWGTAEILTESMFRWDEYMVDMVLNTDENAM